MDESHDPLRFVRQLHQILAADKLLVGFFLGAGRPCSIQVPSENGHGTSPLIADSERVKLTATSWVVVDEDGD